MFRNRLMCRKPNMPVKTAGPIFTYDVSKFITNNAEINKHNLGENEFIESKHFFSFLLFETITLFL